MRTSDFKVYAVYFIAILYLGILSYGFLGTGNPPKVSSQDFFSQAALVLAAIGLYNANPPGRSS